MTTESAVRELLARGIVRISFIKKTDGTTREMLCTTHPQLMPPPPAPKLDAAGNVIPTRPMPAGHLLVWDTQAPGLRSFDIETLNAEPVLVEELPGGQ